MRNPSFRSVSVVTRCCPVGSLCEEHLKEGMEKKFITALRNTKKA